MEKIASRLAGFGVPALVLMVAIQASGYVGAAAITVALSALGPGGILGGIGTLGVIGLVTQALAEFGLEAIFSAVVGELIRRGETKETILTKIERYPISGSLKRKLREQVSLCR